MKLKRSLLAWGLCLGLGACAHTKIPQTEIDDTPANREIISLVEQYKEAVESLDTEAVLAMVSAEYYEDNGNTDATDDFNRDGLRQQLTANFKRTKAMQMNLRIDDVQVEAGKAFAELFYEMRAQNEYPSGLKWETSTDRTRIRFVKEGDNWKIIGGI